MSIQFSQRPFLVFKGLSASLAGLVAISSIATLFGWFSNRPFFISPVERHSPINPLAALFFLLAAASMLLLFHYRSRRPLKLTIYISAGLALAICLAEFSEIFLHFSFPFDTFFYSVDELLAVVPTDLKVQMAAVTAFCFILLFLAVTLGSTSHPTLKITSNYVALLVLLISLFALLGHLYGLQPLIDFGISTDMSIYTATLFIAASVGLLFFHSEVGFMATFSSHRFGGILARILIPSGILFVIFLGALTEHLISVDILDEKELLIVVIVSTFMFNIMVVHLLAKKINDRDALREAAEKDLFKKNELYNAVLENSMAGYWDWDLSKDELHVSKAFMDMIGYEGNTLPDKAFREKLVHPDDRQRISELAKQHIASGGAIPFQSEIRCLHKNGSIVWVITKGKVIRWDDNGKPLQMVGSHVNISQLKATNEKLRESESLFSELFVNAPVALAITRASDGTLIDINQGFTELFGYTKAEALGKTTAGLGFYGAEGRQKLMEQMDDKGRLNNKEVTFRVKSGELKVTSFNSFKLSILGEECLISAILDISELKRSEEKLRENQQVFSTLFYKSPLFLTLNEVSTGKIIDANENALRFFGVDREPYFNSEMIYDNFFSDPADRQKISDILAANGALSGYEFEAKNHSGKKYIISVDITLININGVKSWLVAGIDVTARKDAEQKVVSLLAKKVHERTREVTDYKLALDESAIITITDHRGEITYANDNFCRQFKYDKNEIIGQNHRIFNSGEHPKAFFEDLWGTISRGETWQGEIKNKAKDGSFCWVYTTIVPFLDETKRPYQYVAIRFDITARKEAEQSLLNSENNLKSILENSDTAYILIDSELSVKTFNRLASRFTKQHFSKDLQVKTYALDYFPEERQASMAAMMTEAMQGGYPSYEICYQSVDGANTWYFTRLSGVFASSGAPLGLIMQISDISEQKKHELQRKEITLDLVRQNQDLERFTYIVSHNLRSPVSTILGLTNLIKGTDPTDKDFISALNGLEKTSQKLDTVIKDLNNILQIKRQAYYEKKEMVNLPQLAGEILRDLNSLVEKNHGEIILEFSVIELYSIKEYLHSILHNLIFNSLKYHQLNLPPIIHLASFHSNEKVVITIEDNGRGIDLNRHGNQIFGLHKRFNTDTEGKGMGLFMVKTQVESLGGNIRVESEVNKGSRFIIEFAYSRGLSEKERLTSSKVLLPAV